MRKIAVTVLIMLGLITVLSTNAQVRNYEVSTDAENNTKVLKGIISRNDIQNDTAFKWFNDNMKYGQADAAAVAAFKKHAQDIQLVVFGGTWCEDSQNLLPVFYRLVDKSGFPDSSITLIGLDRRKTTLYNLHKVFNVTKAPTFIVMHQGKEIGRVEEYGKLGQVDKELGEIVAATQ
ncbi:thioredoxin family protein [Panacibacter sp. DH6]|uniref:Thioredoxin family protein n=1 Tax=Panacibacter microcysteis TaxID=2793269 RepID=A0A931GXF0_9BACT|nr:thioredoxin family protein [Panacibacter microcysteis]MBG9375539.1 thioredoxin family protein [Panacibacter microcysteis]